MGARRVPDRRTQGQRTIHRKDNTMTSFELGIIAAAGVTLTSQEQALLAGEDEPTRAVILAYRRAMAGLGIPPHPGGRCPRPDCDCRDWGHAVEVRARDLLGLAP